MKHVLENIDVNYTLNFIDREARVDVIQETEHWMMLRLYDKERFEECPVQNSKIYKIRDTLRTTDGELKTVI